MKKKIIWLLALLVVVICATVLLERPNTSTLNLGVIAGVTGQYAPAGEGYIKGFDLAMDQWNSTNSLKFNAIKEDDGFDAVKVDAYAIVSSFTIDAIYNLVHQENKPVALGFEQSKSAEDDNIFQVLPAAKPIQTALGQKIKELGYKNQLQL